MPAAPPTSAAASAGVDAGARRWTLAAAILGSGMAFMDGTVVNVALPALQRGLGASAAGAQWVVEAYALPLSALLLAGGAFGDRDGRRRVYVIGAALFVLASAACAAAPTLALLVAARALQGIGAALLVPGSLALLSAVYPEAERGKAIGTWSAASAITAAVGPVVGGALVDHASWRWAFLLNLPLGLLLAACLRRVPESRGAAAGPPDRLGAVLATAGLGGIVVALVEAPGRGWAHPLVLATGLGGAAALAAFVAAQRHAARSPGAAPMVPPDLFRSRDFTGANVLTLLLYAALGGAMYFVPLDLIQVQGWGATAAGAALLPFVVLMAGLSRAAGALVARTGPRWPLVLGPAVAAAGFALFMRPGVEAGYWGGFFPAIVVLGAGMTITVAPLTTTVMNAVDTGLAGTASGVNNAVSRVAALLAIAGFGALLAARFDAVLPDALRAARLPAGLADALLRQRDRLGDLAAAAGTAPAVAAQVHEAVGNAFVAGFRAVMALSAALALAAALVAAAMIGRATPAAAAAKDTS